MMTTNLNGKTPDIAEENIQKLKQIFPDVFTDGKVDFDKLQQVLGNYIEDSIERYNFTWNGKGQALRLSQTPTLGTLRTCKEESKDWDTTQNLYIEGDNLEVLKLLQKSYHSKVKMIYIDPPYNTGKDFVYPDDFHDSLENYKKITGQVDSNGNRISTNTEASGRYHTDWLNMMYPRLRLARNLLTDDGVIFISIDDNELNNLLAISNDIFGENNRVAIIANIANPKGRSDSKYIATGHEYILIYAKNIDELEFGGFELGEHIVKRYNKADEDGRGYRETDLKKGGFGDKREDRPAMFYYFIYDEQTGLFYPSKTEVKGKISIKPIRADGTDGRWRWGFDTTTKNLDKLTVRWMSTKSIWGVFEKDYLDKRDTVKAPSYWSFKDVNNERGVEAFENYGFSKEIFDNPKPIGTIMRNLQLISKGNNNDIILDFFSGSATTADAVMQLNAEDGGYRKFIMVQLPEPTNEKSEAYKAGFMNICEIGKERIRRAGDKIKQEKGIEVQNLDIGFKVLKLDTSNLRKWQPDYDNLEQTLLDHIDNYVIGRTELDVVYEIMLKYGLDLTYPVDEFTVAEKKVYSIGFGMLMICLDDEITTEVAKGILGQVKELAPESTRVVFKDNGFKSDSNKTNIKEILKCGGIEEFITL